MSVTTNILTKWKEFFYNTGSSEIAVSNAVTNFHSTTLSVKLPTGTDGNTAAAAANGSLVLTVPVDCKLSASYYANGPVALTNATGDDIVVTVSTNGIACSTYNTNAAAQGAVAANAIGTFSTNTVNSYVDAGEKILVVYTMADNTNNYLNGNLILHLTKE